MNKITFLNEFFRSIYGPAVTVKSTDCGQGYIIQSDFGTIKPVWVDILKNGQISIKVKYRGDVKGFESAQNMSERMIETINRMDGVVVDAATKSDVYAGHAWGRHLVWVARLKCDKVW